MRYARSALHAAHGSTRGGTTTRHKHAVQDDAAGRPGGCGKAGIRLVGALWLLTAVVILTTALGHAVQARWAGSIVLPVVAASLALRLVELPHARIGLVLH